MYDRFHPKCSSQPLVLHLHCIAFVQYLIIFFPGIIYKLSVRDLCMSYRRIQACYD